MTNYDLPAGRQDVELRMLTVETDVREKRKDGESLMADVLLATGDGRPATGPRRVRPCPASQKRNNPPREPGTLKAGPKRGKSGRKYPLEIGAQAARNERLAGEQGPGKGQVRDPGTDESTL